MIPLGIKTRETRQAILTQNPEKEVEFMEEEERMDSEEGIDLEEEESRTQITRRGRKVSLSSRYR